MHPQDDPGRRPDQAQRLRQLVAQINEPSARAHVVAVASGKGGVGKTMYAVNIAIALAARGHRVVLFDADMGLANADIVLGVEPTCTWSDLIAGRREIDEVVIDAPGHIAFVPGASGVARLANLSEFERHQLMESIQRIESRFDVVILDCGAGISSNVVAFACLADTVLVLATPEPTAITDAYGMIKAMATFAGGGIHTRNPDASIGLVVNQAAGRQEGREVYERISGVAAKFLHLPVSDHGYVLKDEHVSLAVRERRPVMLGYPRCSASQCLSASAARLSRELGRGEAQRGLFYRVMNMFM